MPVSSFDPTKITILALSGSTMMTLASVMDPLRAANRLSDTPLFDWKLVSPNGGDIELSGGLTFPVTSALHPADSGNFLIVVASFNHQEHASPELIKKLRLAARNFDTVCGVEAGPWLLASAGQLEDRRVTTHWEDLENLQQRYPGTDVSNERFVIDGRIWTCGGASPALDMMLHLIEQRCSRQLALETASVFVYDQRHTASDRQPTISLGILVQDEPRVAAAIHIMENHLDSPITTAAIAKRVGISSKTLENLFARSLNETPGAYYLKLRLQVARKLAIDTRLGMQEIAIRTGFGSQSAFSRGFRNRFQISPSKLRQSGR